MAIFETTLIRHYLGKPSEIDAEGEIVLRRAKKHDGEYEYVTHFHNLEDGGFYNGHYFAGNQYVQAVRDFANRVAEHSPHLDNEGA